MSGSLCSVFSFLYCRIEKMASMSRRIDVENFSNTNFEMWKLKMEDLLIDQDLWDVIDDSKKRFADPTLAAQYDKIDRKVKGLIKLCLADSILINVHEESIAMNFGRS